MMPKGWNTWDPYSYTTYSYLNDGRREFRIRISFYDVATDRLTENVSWQNIHALGSHTLDGTFSEVALMVDGKEITLEQAADGDRIVLKITAAADLLAVVVFISPFDEKPERNPDGLEFSNFKFRCKEIRNPRLLALKLEDAYMVGVVRSTGWVTGSRDGSFTVEEGAALLETCRAAALKKGVRGDGYLKNLPQACMKTILWNTVYDREKGLCTPVTREWCKLRRGTMLFAWDTCFESVVCAIQHPELGYANLIALVNGMVDGKFVPNVSTSNFHIALDRSQPPVGASALLKLYKMHPDNEKAKYIYDRLCAWNRWWFPNRGGSANGLLSWGSNVEPKYHRHGNKIKLTILYGGALESGLDNSPMYDDIPCSSEHNSMMLNDVGLNAFYAADCLALSRLASLLGKPEEEAVFLDEYEKMKERINRLLWCEEKGIYLNRYWDGRFSDRISPTCFYPMLARIPDEQQAKRLVQEHLLNEQEFYGDFILPSISKNDPAYKDNDYWRGRIWAPMNYLVSEGLRNYSFPQIQHELASKSRDLFLKQWNNGNRCYENYNSVTGEGGDVANSDQLYTWGNLLAYLAIEEVIDVETLGGLRIGSLYESSAAIDNYQISGHSYRVEIRHGKIEASKDGIIFLRTDGPAVVRFAGLDNRCPEYDVRIETTASQTRVELRQLEAGRKYRILMNGILNEQEINDGICIL